MLILDSLNADESHIAFAAVRAIVEGPWFPPGNPDEDQELQTVLGFTREQLHEILGRLHAEIAPDNEAKAAISLCLGNVLGFPAPEGSPSRWLAASEDEIEAVHRKWRQAIGR